MRHKKRGKAAKKARAATATQAREEAFAKAPHTFVFQRGKVGRNIRQLVIDMRKVFEPYTATKLRVTKSNSLRDLVEAAGVLHVTHLLALTKTELSPYLRVMRSPRGPTLTFRILEYCLSRDVVSSLRRPNVEQSVYQTPPLLVMNNLSGESLDKKLMSTMFQNMLPSIDVNKVKLSSMRRTLLITYDKETKTLEMRHYLIRVTPTGIKKTTRKLLRPKLPNLGGYQGIEEFVEKGGNASESEGEFDGPHNQVVLPQEVRGRGNVKATQSAIRLKEVGPRLKMQLVKIEEGLGEGAVLHHEFVTKTPEEQQNLKAMLEKKRQLKEKRKREQLQNIRKKQDKKETLKKKSLEGMKKKLQTQKKEENADVSSDDDAAYFKEEVGKEPDEGTLPGKRKRPSPTQRKQGQPANKKKRRKL
ncbi:suppressor of SWI4 1 homolog [Littorina saxatilis]|uniref:Brix domain-containing protein n=1 Tax=Littorina saxatilis TaxID=31220 RepID=A0AAN9BUB8_9CAEN